VTPPTAWSVYIHFPYCLRRCAYCDFATTVVRDIPREAYLAAVLAELRLRTRDLPPMPVQTVFFGGGTPSLWGERPVAAVLAWLDAWGGLCADAEVSLEANPGASQAGALGAFAAAGVNRISIGVQALDDLRLLALDRLHDAATALATLAELRALLASGRLRSASADLIFGAPGQTRADLDSDVQRVLDHGLPHLSVYGLTVEPGTPLHRRVAAGLQPPPDEDTQADMLAALPERCASYQLYRYEVSNYAQTDHRCRHNLAYWSGRYYLAVGVGAHGFLPAPDRPLVGRRYGNSRNHQKWMAALARGGRAEELTEDIDAATHLTERVLTGLRLTEGLDLDALRRDVGHGLVDGLQERAARAIRRGRPLRMAGSRLVIPQTALHLMDTLVLDLV